MSKDIKNHRYGDHARHANMNNMAGMRQTHASHEMHEMHAMHDKHIITRIYIITRITYNRPWENKTYDHGQQKQQNKQQYRYFRIMHNKKPDLHASNMD